MATNEERKKVAARLREIDFEWVSDSSARLLFKIEHVLGLYVEGVDNLEGVANRLADLIEPEEFTCKMEPSFITPTTLENIQEYTCGKCGKQTLSEVLGDDEDVPKYCSYCGAKVLENLWE